MIKGFSILIIFHMLHTWCWCVEDVGEESYSSSSKTIRTFNGREVRIENSVTRVPVTYSSFDSCNKLGVILSILRQTDKYIFDQEMFGSAPIFDVLTSCTRLPYTPSC